MTVKIATFVRTCRVALGMCLITALLVALMQRAAAADDDRDYARVIGKPEMLPYAASVANALSLSAHRKFPQIEQSSEIGSQRAFCTTLRDSPDIIISPVPHGAPEGGLCSGGLPVMRLPFGRQVITVYTAPGAPPLRLSMEQLFRAIARELPRRDAQSVSEDMFAPNPNRKWRDISPELPDEPIRLIGPPQRSLIWLTLEDMLMRPTCLSLPQVAALNRRDPAGALRHCLSRRTDAGISYVDGTAYMASPRVVPQGTAVAINERRSMLLMREAVMVPIEGEVPDEHALEQGLYPLARDLAAIVKVNRLDKVPNMRQFVMELTSKGAAGPNGYLIKTGLDPLSEAMINESQMKAITSQVH